MDNICVCKYVYIHKYMYLDGFYIYDMYMFIYICLYILFIYLSIYIHISREVLLLFFLIGWFLAFMVHLHSLCTSGKWPSLLILMLPAYSWYLSSGLLTRTSVRETWKLCHLSHPLCGVGEAASVQTQPGPSEGSSRLCPPGCCPLVLSPTYVLQL